MNKAEFSKLYKRMETLYGEKTTAHTKEWFVQFGKLAADDFDQQVTLVIAEYRPFGQDRWPTPGEFNHIIRLREQEREQPVIRIDSQVIAEEAQRKRADLRKGRETA